MQCRGRQLIKYSFLAVGLHKGSSDRPEINVSLYCIHVEVFFYTADYYRRLSSLLSKWTQVFSQDISHIKKCSSELCFLALENWRNVREVGPLSSILNSSSSRILVGIPEGKGPIGRRTHRWEHNIQMNLQVV
jgi:hypothetical protein